MARLSVIVPVYNAASTLQRCVGSVMSQHVGDMELILVDDGSTDGSSALCDELMSDNDCIRVIHRANGGLSAARNTGIDAAQGTWIAFIDSDDELAPDTLCPNLELLSDEIDLVEFPVAVHYGAPNAYNLDFQPDTISGDKVFPHWIMACGYTHCYAWNKIYRKTLFSTIRFPEGENFEDAAICPQIIRLCRAITYSDRGRYLYYSSGSGITLQYRFANQEPLFRHNLELLQLITAQEFGNECRTKLWNQCLNLLIDLKRCKDADKTYISVNANKLYKLRPGLMAIMQANITFIQGIKALFAWLFGVRTLCFILGIKKYK